MSDNLIAGYVKAAGTKEKPKAAVFTFNTSKELARQHIGFAVSEILSHHLTEKGSVLLLERTEINHVLNELKLNMAGVTDPSDALKAGKLASADILILGSVEKFGELYHVNARIVKTETGEVISTDYETLPVSTFENEARDYVVAVPKTQTIGIYLLESNHGTAKLPETTGSITDSFGTTTETTTPSHPNIPFLGFGLRYTPFNHFIFDMAYINSNISRGTGTRYWKYTGGSSPSEYTTEYTSRFIISRIVVGPQGELAHNFLYNIGGGVSFISISGEGSTRYATPTLLARLEFHPQERLGISLAAGYDTTAKTATTYTVNSYFKTTRLQQFYIEPSIALYF
jgi:hypothetical protein